MASYKLSEVIAQRPTKTIYRDGNYVIKVVGDAYSVCDVLSEAHNLAAVGETSLKVPRLIEVTKIDGKWAIVWEYVAGRTLAELMDAEPGKADEYLGRFVDLQLTMSAENPSRLPRFREKLHRKIEISGMDASTRYELASRLDGMPRHRKLIHGDWHPSNVVITDGGQAYIIDWSHAARGNASAETAQTYLLFYWRDKKPELAKKYIELFCKKSDTARQYVEKWLSIVAACRMPAAAPDEREFLMQWASVAEYQ